MKQKITLEDLAQMTQKGLMEVKKEVSSVKKEVSSVKKDVVSVKKEVSSVKYEVLSVKKEMRQGFSHVNARIDILENDIQKLASRKEVHELENRVTIIEEKMHIAY